MRQLFPIAAALLTAAHCAGAVGHDAPVPVLAPGAYLSGGIGEEERQRLRESRDLFNLRLAFAEVGSGAYIPGVEVTIESVGAGPSYGPFVDSGPILYVALKPGTYLVRATYAGVVRATTVRVGKGATAATLYWPVIPAPAGGQGVFRPQP